MEMYLLVPLSRFEGSSSGELLELRGKCRKTCMHAKKYLLRSHMTRVAMRLGANGCHSAFMKRFEQICKVIRINKVRKRIAKVYAMMCES